MAPMDPQNDLLLGPRCILTFLSPIEVDLPGMMEIPWSSGNGIDPLSCIRTRTPASVARLATYSVCSMNNSRRRPEDRTKGDNYCNVDQNNKGN